MYAVMISRLATVTFLGAIALAFPIPGDTDLVRCVSTWDSRRIACSDHQHHFYCDNLPGIRAGTGAFPTRMKPRNQLESPNNNPLILQSRKDYDGGTYCQARTNTFIVAISFNAANAGVSAFLNTCLNAVQRIINRGHTGLIPNDGWHGPLGRNGLYMNVFSEDDHQMTYGVLHSAIQAVITWMSSNDHTFGTGSFAIWDGNHQVGYGDISQ